MSLGQAVDSIAAKRKSWQCLLKGFNKTEIWNA